ncbi:MAG: FeoA domain-containing protein, partial [Methanogenium sp.]|nr:FeoA domain-containing protein [Methanogenium sp.]
EGGVFRMISGERGPVLIEIKGSILAIGRGMAEKIRVTKV